MSISSANIARLNQTAATYARGAFVPEAIGRRLLARLPLVRMQPRNILDLGSGTNTWISALQTQYPQAHIVGCDVALARCQSPSIICADAHALPFASKQFDCIVSNSSMHGWDLPKVFAECHRVLRPGGCFLWTTWGPDTLKELTPLGCDRSSFLDMHDLGDIALHAKFKDPVLDRQDLQVQYPHVIALLRDLQDMGESTTQTSLYPLRTAIRSAPKPFTASYEILYGLAFTHPDPATYSIAPVHYPE